MNAFWSRPAPLVAPELIGWQLVVNGIHGTIAETEAYFSEDDLACHASKGRTPRTATLYAQPGTLYVYLCYGMHHLVNVVTDREGIPSAVLIRGVIIDGLDPRRSNGPGKVAKLLGLDRRHNGQALGEVLHMTAPPANRIPPKVSCGPRVGIDYAGDVWRDKPWRWWLAGFPAVKTRTDRPYFEGDG